MALQMVRPTKHPRIGIYHVRLAVPPPRRETAKGLFGAGWELAENLGTKDPSRAKDAAPAAVERLKAKMEAVRLPIPAPLNGCQSNAYRSSLASSTGSRWTAGEPIQVW